MKTILRTKDQDYENTGKSRVVGYPKVASVDWSTCHADGMDATTLDWPPKFFRNLNGSDLKPLQVHDVHHWALAVGQEMLFDRLNQYAVGCR